jgi:hypothetical protein
MLPEDPDMIPDVFIHLFSDEKSLTRDCYKRLNASELIKQTADNAPAQWIWVDNDESVHNLSDAKSAGLVLVRLGLEKIPSSRDQVTAGGKRKGKGKGKGSQGGRNLPASDANELLDPFLKITCCGQEQQCATRNRTRAPQWFETLCFDVELYPDMQLNAPIGVDVYDADPIFSDKFCACLYYKMQAAFALPRGHTELPDPMWRELYVNEPGDLPEGHLLIAVQLVRLPSTSPPPSIRPLYRQCWIEVIALGCRGLQPYKCVPIVKPFVKFLLSADDYKSAFAPHTDPSSKPSGSDPNFLQRIVIPCQMPENALFAPALNLEVHDSRLGGLDTPLIGTACVPLETKLPWSSSFVAPQVGLDHNQIQQMLARRAAGAGTMGGRSAAEEAPSLDDEKEGGTDNEGGELLGSRRNSFWGTPSPRSKRSSSRSSCSSFHRMFRAKANDSGTGVGIDGEASAASAKEKDEDENKPPAWKVGRVQLDSELEQILGGSPFEIFDLKLGHTPSKFGGLFSRTTQRAQTKTRVTGRFKGLVRVMLNEDEQPLFDLKRLLQPSHYLIRCYCLHSKQLNPMDTGFGGRPGKSDPYLKLKLGKETFNDRKNYALNATDVDHYQLVELKATLPGAARLEIKVMDYDMFGSDSLIGKTVIDLEDRLFDQKWESWGTKEETADRYRLKPIEVRDLYVPTSARSQGQLSLWVDILSPAVAAVCDPVDIALPPDEMFEVRVIVWKTRKIPGDNGISDLGDLYVKAGSRTRSRNRRTCTGGTRRARLALTGG